MSDIDVNDIDVKAMKAAVNDLNKIIGAKEKIKLTGTKKVDVCNQFKTIVDRYVSKDKTDDLPDSVIAFYNEYFAEDDENEEEETKKDTGKKDSGKKGSRNSNRRSGGSNKKDTGKKDSGKKGGDKKSDAPEARSRGNGVIPNIVRVWFDDGLRTTGDILKELEPLFPGKPIKSTIQQTVCILNHVDAKISKKSK